MTSQPPATLVDAHELILNESGYVVSVLTDADIDDYVALVASAYRGEASKQGWTTERTCSAGSGSMRRWLGRCSPRRIRR